MVDAPRAQAPLGDLKAAALAQQPHCRRLPRDGCGSKKTCRGYASERVSVSRKPRCHFGTFVGTFVDPQPDMKRGRNPFRATLKP